MVEEQNSALGRVKIYLVGLIAMLMLGLAMSFAAHRTDPALQVVGDSAEAAVEVSQR